MDQSQFQCSKLRVDLAKENSDQLSCETTFCRRTLITNANKVKFLGYHVLASDPVSKSPSPTTQKLQPYIFFILIFIYIKNESNWVGKLRRLEKSVVLLGKFFRISTLLCDDQVLDMDSMLLPKKYMKRNLGHQALVYIHFFFSWKLS